LDSQDKQPREWQSSSPQQRVQQRRRTLGGGLAFLVVILFVIIYYVFFHIHSIGSRAIVVNGENVEQIDGFSVHSSTWLSQSQTQRFLGRIQMNNLPATIKKKTFRGVVYVRATDVAHALTLAGDKSGVADGQLVVQLRPGQHYTYQDKEGSIRQEQILVRGKGIGYVLALYHKEATYVPAAAVAGLLQKADIQSSWNGKSLQLMLTKAASPTAVLYPKQDGLIEFGPGQSLYAPDFTWLNDTYLPQYSLGTALGQQGWTSKFGTWSWALTPAGKKPAKTSEVGGAAAGKPVLMGFVTFYGSSLASLDDALNHPSSYNAVAEDTWAVTPSGSLSTSAPSGSAGQAAMAGDTVYTTVTNLDSNGFDGKEMAAILADSAKSRTLIDNITSGVLLEGSDGAMLDFESIPAANRDEYSAFVSALAKELHAEGKSLAVSVPADTGSDNEPWNDAYDEAKIGQVADYVVVMAYDYSYPGSKPGPIAPVPWVQQSLAYTISRVPAGKILLGMNAYGYDWTSNPGTSASLLDVDHLISIYHIKPKWDAAGQAPWFQWKDSQGTVHTVWYENARSISAKLNLTKTYGIDGVAVWRTGLENNTLLNALSQYAKGK